jgi:hypothetical protein
MTDTTQNEPKAPPTVAPGESKPGQQQDNGGNKPSEKPAEQK